MNLRAILRKSILPGITWMLVTAPAIAWGPQAHRVAGTLTEGYLAADTRDAVEALIGAESLAQASIWADRMRDNPSPFWQRQAGPWHYVTVPPGKTWAEVGAPEKGDAMTALAAFHATLQDPAAPRVRKQLALRFALHIIQDLHQPLHVGNGRDRGGNAIEVVIEGQGGSNLHRVWDSAILADAGLSDAVWIDRLRRIPPAEVRRWRQDGPEVWIAESAALRDRIYPQGKRIDAAYLRKHLPDVQRRLQQSAVRGAAWLEGALGNERGR